MGGLVVEGSGGGGVVCGLVNNAWYATSDKPKCKMMERYLIHLDATRIERRKRSGDVKKKKKEKGGQGGWRGQKIYYEYSPKIIRAPMKREHHPDEERGDGHDRQRAEADLIEFARTSSVPSGFLAPGLLNGLHPEIGEARPRYSSAVSTRFRIRPKNTRARLGGNGRSRSQS